MTTFGFDLSRYDALEDVKPEFVILNVEDPGFADKVRRAVAHGIPWGVYLWIYPGKLPAVAWMHDRTLAVGCGEPPVGYWADYEEGGVTPDQLVSWFAQTDNMGLKAGYYSGPTAVDHRQFLGRWWWCAAYPGTNSGAYPGTGALWPSSKPRPMQLWQFTSTNGTLDQDSVEDPAWWSIWLGAAAPAPIEATPKGKSMELLSGPTPFGRLAILVDAAGDEVGRWTSTGQEGVDTVFGTPKAAADVMPKGATLVVFSNIDLWMKTVQAIDARKAAPAVPTVDTAAIVAGVLAGLPRDGDDTPPPPPVDLTPVKEAFDEANATIAAAFNKVGQALADIAG